MWRGGCRLSISVAASFVWRCLSGSAMAPFPHPAHRTGHADLPYPALGQELTLSRATPSAASEHLSELIGFPISMSFTTYCVCLELRSLPSTGVTRIQRCRVGGGALDCSCAGLRPPHSRVEGWRAGAARESRLTPRLQPPPRRTQRADFPHCAPPFAFTPTLMGPIL